MELQSLVGLPADHRRVGQVTPVTHMPEDSSSAGRARAWSLVTLSSVPLVTHVDPREPDSLLLLGGGGARGLLLGSLGRLGLHLGPSPVERGPIGSQLTRSEES